MNVVLIGLIGVSPLMISAYAMAEKIIKSIQAVVRPLNQLFFPKAVRALKQFSAPSAESFRALTRHTYIQVIAVLLIVGCGVLSVLLAERVVLDHSSNTEWPEILSLVSMMLPAIAFGVMSFMYGVVGLNHLGAQPYLFKSLLFIGLLNVPMCVLLASFLNARGAALAFVLSEIALLILISSRYFRRPESFR